ncbi:GHKL domain-containing protein [Vallitalea pronyensis]|uniref:histidine kinase n=1 Tax=Vallitalea pronyensis TaxID=1348613 RepID=A0A8J8SI79_9FIRM|nr:HAMP domain-containing sensor histidine kinase [Vallitalea pronyensis]QUI24326.1 GHKL domain-containing protein [Vallitalea pronyensis]
MKKIKSIRTKIILVFSMTFFILLLLLLLLNKFFLDDFYIKSNSNNMIKASREFETEYKPEAFQEQIAELVKRTGGDVFLFPEELFPVRAASGRHNKPPVKLEHLKIIRDKAVQSAEEGHLEILGSGDIEDQRIIYARAMADGQLVLIVKRMGLVSEATGMFYSFMLLTSIAVYLVGIIISFIIAKGVSKPIIKMKETTYKMADLQFDEKLIVRSYDEVGELMNSVNQMADALSEAIHALKVSNHQLTRELSKEKSLEKMRRRFVSDVSHELKNPISLILGYADGLVQKIPKSEEAKEEYYSIIVDEASRMHTLVKDLLDLSGYESGTFTIDMEPFIVNELIDNALERLHFMTDNKTVRIDYDTHRQYVLTADRLRTSQIIINLLSNAFKHVNDNGTIKIELSKQTQGLKILIANTGVLIPDKELDQIWNSFYQIDTENRGNGLGLAIVKSIVKLHEGSYRAYTQNGYNCFEIIL